MSTRAYFRPHPRTTPGLQGLRIRRLGRELSRSSPPSEIYQEISRLSRAGKVKITRGVGIFSISQVAVVELSAWSEQDQASCPKRSHDTPECLEPVTGTE